MRRQSYTERLDHALSDAEGAGDRGRCWLIMSLLRAEAERIGDRSAARYWRNEEART